MNIQQPTWQTPFWYRGYKIYLADCGPFNFNYCHDSYDGVEDSHDNRCGYANTVDECKSEIDEKEDD